MTCTSQYSINNGWDIYQSCDYVKLNDSVRHHKYINHVTMQYSVRVFTRDLTIATQNGLWDIMVKWIILTTLGHTVWRCETRLGWCNTVSKKIIIVVRNMIATVIVIFMEEQMMHQQTVRQRAVSCYVTHKFWDRRRCRMTMTITAMMITTTIARGIPITIAKFTSFLVDSTLAGMKQIGAMFTQPMNIKHQRQTVLRFTQPRN